MPLPSGWCVEQVAQAGTQSPGNQTRVVCRRLAGCREGIVSSNLEVGTPSTKAAGHGGANGAFVYFSLNNPYTVNR